MLNKLRISLAICLFTFIPQINSVDKGSIKQVKKTEASNIEKLELQIEKKEIELKGLKDKLESLKEPKVIKGKTKGKVFYDLGSGLGKVTLHAYLYDAKNPDKAKKFIEDEYKDIRAEISDDERNMVSKGKLGSPVYGEIKVDSFEKILKDPDLDIDCFTKAVGIELSPTRYHHALTISKRLKEDGLEIPGKKLEFINENIAESNLSDADIIFMCSTCYPDELMELLVKKLSKLKNGLIVISLKSMPNYKDHGFKLVKELSLPMTWSEGSPVNIYKLDKSQKTKEEKDKKATKKLAQEII